jgi:hypothetical protein
MIFDVFFLLIFLFLVEHLIQWFSLPNVIELQPTAISLDIQNPIIEMKFKQVKKNLKKIYFIFPIYSDSSYT